MKRRRCTPRQPVARRLHTSAPLKFVRSKTDGQPCLSKRCAFWTSYLLSRETSMVSPLQAHVPACADSQRIDSMSSVLRSTHSWFCLTYPPPLSPPFLQVKCKTRKRANALQEYCLAKVQHPSATCMCTQSSMHGSGNVAQALHSCSVGRHNALKHSCECRHHPLL